MGISNFLTMNAGDDHNSYAKNSSPQKSGILKARPIVDEALQSVCKNNFPFPSKCLRIADLGCSSGPNTLLFISNAIDTILRFSQLHQIKGLPQFQVFLNDLPQNDFNNLFKLLPTFYEKLQQISKLTFPIQCYISASPGSFYGRLFPNNSMDFIHSSYSLHRLSQVPDGLGNDNKGDIYISKKTPQNVIEAYSKQYRKDLSAFLSSRAEEIIPGGRMVVLIVCRDEADHAVKDANFQITMVSTSLLDLAAQGLVKEEDIDSFNVPMFFPHEEEVKGAIEREGSFEVNKLEVIEINWVESNNYNHEEGKKESARIVAGVMRAVMEPLLINHFGNSVIDSLFERYTKNLTDHPCGDHISDFVAVVSLSRK